MKKNFRSADGTVKRVVCDNGHIILVDKEWIMLQDWAWKFAYSVGCVSEDMLGTGYSTDQHIMTKGLMKDFLRSAVEEHPEIFHPKTNIPLANRIRKYFPEYEFTSQFIQESWKELLKETD